MKRLLLPALSAALVLVACGTGSVEVASPLSVIPDRAMITIVLNDPAGMVRNIDEYIAEGAPILGEKLLENIICGQLEVSSLDSVQVRYGFNPSGQIAFWMESAMPQSMAMAVSAPDFPLFISLLEEMGVEFSVEDPIDGAVVYSMQAEDGTMYMAGVDGVALMAMSAEKLETLISSLSSDASVQIPETSLFMQFNLSMIGPMAVAQMPMARMIITQGMAADTTMPYFVPAMMDVYMDGIEVFLTQADMLELTLTTGEEDFVARQKISFLPDTYLAGMSMDQQDQDMLGLITNGDVATVKLQMPSEMAFDISKAFTEVFISEADEEMLRFWAEMASSGAVSIYNDNLFHVVAAYQIDEDITVEDIARLYTEYLEMFVSAMGENTDLGSFFTVQDNGVLDINGTDFYSMSMTIASDSTGTMEFEYWLTVHNGALLLEMASEPSILLSIVSGDYTPAVLESDGEMAGEISLAGYINLLMAMSPNGMDIPEIGSDVIIRWNGNYADGAMSGEMVMDGSDAFATGFAFFGLIAATQ
ncbi:MAG: hypothetical protein J7K88_04600 [Candidatus Fermentibacteraceae bacterium]|nr:hypothetical protein [Candidatus Fermentibacteraceae bacterium]